MRLYTYYRSSAAYRVRIALNLKGAAVDAIPVHLRNNEQLAPAYRALNPQGLVPTLMDEDFTLSQSLAIVEYLDEMHPEPPLLPRAPRDRAHVRRLAYIIACDVHPLNNLRVLRYLKDEYDVDEALRGLWQRHWITQGLAAIEALLANSPETGRFSHGDTPTLADICLVPQIYNARRIDVDLAPYPNILRIETACSEHPAFAAAHPARQPDAE